MPVQFKTTWTKVSMNSIRVIIFIVTAGILAACTKTEDYLRELVTKNSDLVDPSSAIFRNVTYRTNPPSLGLWDTYCGEINAKNRIGGYVGWKPFKITDLKDGKVFIILLQPKEVPFSASVHQRDSIEKLNKNSADSFESDCRDSQPASSWIPFWKAF